MQSEKDKEQISESVKKGMVVIVKNWKERRR